MFVRYIVRLNAEFFDLGFTTYLSIFIKLIRYDSSATTVNHILDFVIVIAN